MEIKYLHSLHIVIQEVLHHVYHCLLSCIYCSYRIIIEIAVLCSENVHFLQITTESIEVTNPTSWNGNLFFNSPTVCAVSALTEAWLSQIFQNYQDSDLGTRKCQFHPSKIDAESTSGQSWKLGKEKQVGCSQQDIGVSGCTVPVQSMFSFFLIWPFRSQISSSLILLPSNAFALGTDVEYSQRTHTNSSKFSRLPIR